MFDTNIYNRILDGAIPIPTPNPDRTFFATHIQIDELANTKNEERRKRLLDVFKDVTAIKLPTESAVWGISKWDEAKFSDEVISTESFVLGSSRLGMAKLSDGTLYNSLLNDLKAAKPKEKDQDANRRDALIAETSIKNKLILVTEDEALFETTQKHSGQAIKLSEL